jgi:hypothetical protein
VGNHHGSPECCFESKGEREPSIGRDFSSSSLAGVSGCPY